MDEGNVNVPFSAKKDSQKYMTFPLACGVFINFNCFSHRTVCLLLNITELNDTVWLVVLKEPPQKIHLEKLSSNVSFQKS